LNISVVIPLYNKQDYIGETIASCLRQTSPVDEIIVVDDGSTDDSLRVVKGIEDSRIRIIKKRNGGCSSARNIGIKEAKSEFVALLDADDYWHPDFIKTIRGLINDFPQCHVFATAYGLTFEGRVRNAKIRGVPKNGVIKNYIIPFARGESPLHVSNTVIRRKYFEIIGYFNEDVFAEDLEMWMRLTDNNVIAYRATVMAYWRQNVKGQMTEGKIYNSDLCFVKVLQKGKIANGPLAKYYKKALAKSLQCMAANNLRYGNLASALPFIWRKEALYPTSGLLRIGKSVLLKAAKISKLRK